MSHQMPPGQIMLLIQIHCFVYVDQLTMLNGSPAAKKFTQRLMRDELICVDPRCSPYGEERERHPFNTTERGRFMIEKWCETPLPVLEERWV